MLTFCVWWYFPNNFSFLTNFGHICENVRILESIITVRILCKEADNSY